MREVKVIVPEVPQWFDDWVNNTADETDGYITYLIRNIIGMANCPTYNYYKKNVSYYTSSHFELFQWEYVSDNTIKLIKALVLGYDVKDLSDRYCVRLAEDTYLSRTALGDNIKLEVSTGLSSENVLDESIEGYYQFTEAEIKDYDDRYWPFAIAVEDLYNEIRQGD